jgi:predicted nuclease of restriction endonuclease-like (RecB) superfamily
MRVQQDDRLAKLVDPAARLYYLRAAAQYGWTRNVLLAQIKAGAFERARREKKLHNFRSALPVDYAEQADEMMKSRYQLEFLGLGKPVKERELEDRLIARLQEFLLELGYGFCFVGRQYRLVLGRKEYFVDLLFYHRFLKALVAFDLKVGAFEPEHAGKMDFYLNLLNEQQRAPGEAEEHPDRRVPVGDEAGGAEAGGAALPAQPDLDPQLVWRGKDEQDWSDLVVHAPPLYIQEKVHPKVLIDDLRKQTRESAQ